MTQSSPTHYSYPPTHGGKWLRRGVLIIVFIALAILFLQASRPRFGNAKDNIPWRTKLSDALAESKKTGKPVLADFSASWCPPCQDMKHASWPDPKVEAVVKEKYIPVLLDADASDTEGPARKYAVEYLPTILVLDSDGKVLRQGDYMTASELLAFLSGGREPQKKTPSS
jgi:thiol-disulfide isomerase/thioredoxin